MGTGSMSSHWHMSVPGRSTRNSTISCRDCTTDRAGRRGDHSRVVAAGLCSHCTAWDCVHRRSQSSSESLNQGAETETAARGRLPCTPFVPVCTSSRKRVCEGNTVLGTERVHEVVAVLKSGRQTALVVGIYMGLAQ
jgi:hypothetical protein